MAKAILAKSPSGRGVKMPTSDKPCKYPGCGVIFNGIGAAKYCEEHRKPEYRKILNAIRAKEKEKESNIEKPNNSNTIIQHQYSIATKITRTCACGKEYELTLFPTIEIYPKYCEEHRNPFKRDMLLKRLGMADNLIKADHHNIKNSDEATEFDPKDVKMLEDEFGDDLFNNSQEEDDV